MAKNSRYVTPDGYTADIAVFTIVSHPSKPFTPPEMSLKIMLIKRNMLTNEGGPNVEAGKWALPGGFVKPAEDAMQAAVRELEEETGITNIHMRHFAIYDKPGRDPRGWIISNAHYAIVPASYLENRKASDDAAQVELFTVEEALAFDLAFDHKQIIEDALTVIKRVMLQTTAAKNFLPEEFTYSELQAVLATVTSDPAILNEQAFARKIKTLPFIELAEGKTTQRTSKKATKLYRFKDMEIVNPIYTARY